MKFKKGLSALTVLLALATVSCGTKTSKQTQTSSQAPAISKSSSQVSVDSKSSLTSSQSDSFIPAGHTHTWGAPTYEWNSDYSKCTATRVCSRNANHIETETVDSAYVLVNSATCCAEGLGRYTAEFTNTAFATQTHEITYDIDTNAHNYTETVVAATADEEGYTLHECSHCHNTFKTDIVSAENKFTYEEYNSGYKITGYTGEAEIINVPETHNGLQVKCIGKIASGRVIHVPDSITMFDGQCFKGNTELEEVNIPEGTTELYNAMFMECTSLKSIVIPDSVMYINGYAFNGCTSLEEMTLPFIGQSKTGANRFLGAIFGAYTYNTNDTYVPQSLKKVTISSVCTELYGYDFFRCKYIEEVVLGENITTIGQAAFGETAALKEINLPKKVSSIDPYAFGAINGADGIETINVDPENEYYSSENGILYNKDKTVLVRYPGGKKGDSFTIPNMVTEIASQAFRYCTNLKSVVVNDNVTTLNSSAFDTATCMESIVLSNNIKVIPNSCFLNCLKLASITLPNKLEEIGSRAFYSNDSLKTITIPNTVTKIGEDAFAFDRLTNIIFEGNIRNIQFDENWNKTTVFLPKITIAESDAPYGLRVNNTTYAGGEYVGFGDNNNRKYIQFRGNAELSVGDTFVFYDNVMGGQFDLTIDPYSLGGTSSSSENWKEYFDYDGDKYTAKQDGTYYFYIKINGTAGGNIYFYI